jgi:hypothetical protein
MSSAAPAAAAAGGVQDDSDKQNRSQFLPLGAHTRATGMVVRAC